MNSRALWPALLAMVAIGILTDCSKTGTGPASQSGAASNPAGSPRNLLTAEGQALLRTAISSGNSDLRWPDFTDYGKHVKKFYDLNGDSLWWVKDLEPTPQARQLIRLILQAGQKGLSAGDYDGPLWSNRLAALKPSTRQPAEVRAKASQRDAMKAQRWPHACSWVIQTQSNMKESADVRLIGLGGGNARTSGCSFCTFPNYAR
jgi:hypothetical protein